MIKTLAYLLSPLLKLPPIRRIRRNHALEHATVHMLSRRIKQLSVSGNASLNGFLLYGNVDTALVQEAAEEALRRMQVGESQWAVHPNCGTMLVTSGVMTSLAAVAGLMGVQNTPRATLDRLPTVILLSIVALISSQPVGLSVQKHITTCGEMGDLALLSVTRHEVRLPIGGKAILHRIQTRGGW